MSGLKNYHPDIAYADNKVAPDETDWYRQYKVILPALNTTVGTAPAAGTNAVSTITVTLPVADYPRSLALNYIGTGTGGGGSATINGRDQFGQVITETIGQATGVGTAGTTAGTKIFAQITSGTFTFGSQLGPGTPLIQFGTTGTTAKFGLPDKIQKASDVIMFTSSAGILTGGSAVNNGTISAFVDAATHAFRAPTNVTGTTVYTVLYKSTYDSSSENLNAGLTQLA